MQAQPRTVIPRVLAGASGCTLVVFTGVALYLAQVVRNLVEDGHRYLSDAGNGATQLIVSSTDGDQTAAALFAASWVERFAHGVLGDVGSAAQRFQVLLVVTLLAASAAIVIAARRLPHARHPEMAWGAAAILALLPATMLQLWLIIAVPLAGSFALAATLHWTRRHDLTVARGTAAAKRQVANAQPHAKAVTQWSTDTAGRVGQAGLQQLPAAREHAETLGRKGHALARQAAPIARSSLSRLRRRSDGP